MRWLAVLGLAVMLSAPAAAQDTLIVGLQESGTVQWEIAAMRNLGLDAAHDARFDIRPLADSRAGQIALQAGAVDVILSDFVWVSIQRDAGNPFTMVPHSLAVGGLMVPPDSTIATVEDLEGRTIGVAGGPADKSWVILQAYYNSLTGSDLAEAAEARFGAPPLINELLTSGRIDAGLNFWQWNARAKAQGSVELIAVSAMLAALGVAEQPPLLGWTFSENMAPEKQAALHRFLEASFATKQALLIDAAVWEPLAGLMGAEGDPALFAQLREDYRAGIVTGYDPADTAAAEQAFALMAQFGGSDVVGNAEALAEGTFWSGYRK